MSIYSILRSPLTLWMSMTYWYYSNKDVLSNHHTDTIRARAGTRYTEMLRQEAEVRFTYNIIASAANWILLAGYLVVPGTFTSLQHSDQVESALSHNEAGRKMLHTIHNPPLLGIACLFLVGGIAALVWLLRFNKLRSIYPWLINKIFM